MWCSFEPLQTLSMTYPQYCNVDRPDLGWIEVTLLGDWFSACQAGYTLLPLPPFPALKEASSLDKDWVRAPVYVSILVSLGIGWISSPFNACRVPLGINPVLLCLIHEYLSFRGHGFCTNVQCFDGGHCLLTRPQVALHTPFLDGFV